MKYISMIPLIGGQTFGHIKALGVKPSAFISYPPFAINESHLYAHLPDVPRYLLDPDTNEPMQDIPPELFDGIDFVSVVPPCAGLSMLYSGKDRGSDAQQNQWILKSTHFALGNIKPKVFWGENAPGLYGNIGKDLVKKLHGIAQSYGYSMSLVKTDTMFHGIPQKRPRTFFFFWNTPVAPILPFYSRPKPDLADYLGCIPSEASMMDIWPEGWALTDDVMYQWAKEKGGDNWRQWVLDNGSNTVLSIGHKNTELLKDFQKFVAGKNKRGERMARHALEKIDMGKGFWDCSPKICIGETVAVIKKNLSNMVHPTEDRWMTHREFMHLMGLPHEFELLPIKDNILHVTQNVPVCTASDWTEAVSMFCRGMLPMSSSTLLRQNNTNRRTECAEIEIRAPKELPSLRNLLIEE